MTSRAICLATVILCLGCSSVQEQRIDRTLTDGEGPRKQAEDDDVARCKRLRRSVISLLERASTREGKSGEEFEALSLLVQARLQAVEHARLRERLLTAGQRTLPLASGSVESLEQRARLLARDLEVVFVLFVKTDGRAEDSREYSSQFVSILGEQTDLRLTIPPVELLSYEQLVSGRHGLGRSKAGLDYLIVARISAELASEAESLFFFKSRASLSIQHIPSGRTVIQAGFPLSETTKYGDPQRKRAAARSVSLGTAQLARLLTRDIERLVSLEASD